MAGVRGRWRGASRIVSDPSVRGRGARFWLVDLLRSLDGDEVLRMCMGQNFALKFELLGLQVGGRVKVERPALSGFRDQTWVFIDLGGRAAKQNSAS